MNNERDVKQTMNEILELLCGPESEREERARNDWRKRIMDRREFLAGAIAADRLREFGDFDLWFNFHSGDWMLKSEEFGISDYTFSHFWEPYANGDFIGYIFNGYAYCTECADFVEYAYANPDSDGDLICEKCAIELFGVDHGLKQVHTINDTLDVYQIADLAIRQLDSEESES